MKRVAIASLLLAAACGTPKTEVQESFEDLAGLDQKSDAFSWRMKIVGSLDYGQTSAPVKYTRQPRFRAFKFAGQPGDVVDARVRSWNGDAVAWVLDDSFRVLGYNDDANGSLDSHVHVTLTENDRAEIDTYYVVFRDYWLDRATFTVELQGQPVAPPDFYSCQLDAECVMVQADCCPHLGFTAIRAGQEDAYKNSLGCADPTFCPAIAIRPEYRVPQCNNSTNKCELVRPEDIACGGRVASGNAHDCPAGWVCYGTNRFVDGTDVCKRECGGFAGLACPSDQTCVDNAYDDCDPTSGGADCGGVCESAPPPADCRTTGCGAGEWCSFCWVSFQCIPNGALC